MADPERGAAEQEPDPPEDGTLAGYFEVHKRPPAFEGSDGHPYTVSPEIERTTNLRAPYAGFLVFPRWAPTGGGIVGHVETPILVERRSSQESMEWMGRLSLREVTSYLEEALAKDRHETT